MQDYDLPSGELAMLIQGHKNAIGRSSFCSFLIRENLEKFPGRMQDHDDHKDLTALG
jgi:hypothetical protein